MEILKYLKPTPDKVWFGVSHEKKPDAFSKATEWALDQNYSHSLSIYWSKDTQDYIVPNCHGVGAQLDTLAQIYKEDEIVHLFECDVTKEQKQAYCQKVVELDGIDYSETNILAIAWSALFGLAKAPFGLNDNDLICSRYTNILGPPLCLGRAETTVGKGPKLINPEDNVFFWQSLCQDLSPHKDRFRQLF